MVKATRDPSPIAGREVVGCRGRGVCGHAPQRGRKRRDHGTQTHTLAIIGDVHANLQALQAVLADIDRRGIRHVWCVGDLVGFGASPQEAVDLLRERGVVSILGNIDEKTLEVGPKREARDPAKREKQQTLHWTYRRLRPECREYLRSLPREMRLKVGGRTILLVHGSPKSIDEYIQEGTDAARLRELAHMADADVIVAGHAHQPFVKRVGKTLFVNTGSVGRPEAGGDRSCYAILTVAPRSIRVRHVFPQYDMAAAVEAIRAAGLPATYGRMIVTGRKFEDARRLEVEDPSHGLAADAVLRAVHALARRCRYEQRHSLHVTKLALGLFDQLREVHHLGDRPRLLLESAGVLHDIGWARGQKGHHKESMRMILAARGLGLSGREQAVVANVARYHRRALPEAGHAEYRRLCEEDRKLVHVLGGLLRLGDGLDCQHLSRVRSIECRPDGAKLVLACRTSGSAGPERQTAEEKKDLLEAALGLPVAMERP